MTPPVVMTGKFAGLPVRGYRYEVSLEEDAEADLSFWKAREVLMGQRKLSLLISREEIAQAVERLAAEIRRDYADTHPLLIGILRGSFIFLADLVRALDIPLTVDFIQAESYQSTTSTGKVKIVHGGGTPVHGRHVLLVEDIVDTGITLRHITGWLKRRRPASLKLCALLDKPSHRLVPVQIDYLGFTVPDRFVVGYGTDLDQQYRYLPDIYAVEEG